MTMEFRLFAGVGRPWRRYRKVLRQRNFQRMPLNPAWQRHARLGAVRSRLVRLSILVLLLPSYRMVTLAALRRALRLTFPGATVVGDKTPDYVRQISRLSDPGLLRIMIYRDPRDVAQSVLHLLERDWKGQPAYEGWDAGVIARNWLAWIDEIERQPSGSLLVVKYEDLVADPARETRRLGDYLGVDAARFAIDAVRDTSVGRYRSSLTPDQVAEIESIAGDAMHRLGYALDFRAG